MGSLHPQTTAPPHSRVSGTSSPGAQAHSGAVQCTCHIAQTSEARIAVCVVRGLETLQWGDAHLGMMGWFGEPRGNARGCKSSRGFGREDRSKWGGRGAREDRWGWWLTVEQSWLGSTPCLSATVLCRYLQCGILTGRQQVLCVLYVDYTHYLTSRPRDCVAAWVRRGQAELSPYSTAPLARHGMARHGMARHEQRACRRNDRKKARGITLFPSAHAHALYLPRYLDTCLVGPT